MVSKKQHIQTEKTPIQNFVKFWLVPFILLMLGFALMILHINADPGISILVYPHSKEETVTWKRSELHAGEKAIGRFVARDNHLGIVAVRFNTFFRINNDYVTFRIKENGAQRWYYENKYRVDQFQPNQYFTFGMPIIDDSEGKTYIFEVESERGKTGDAVAVSSIQPVYVTKYQYAKEKILSDRSYTVAFLSKKTANLFSNPDSVLAFIVYYLPFILYFIWLFLFERYLKRKYYLIFFPLICMLLVIGFDFVRNDVVIIGVLMLWTYLVYLFRFSSVISLSVSFIFIVTAGILYYLGIADFARGLSLWAFFTLALGVLQQFFELKFPEKKMVDLQEILMPYLRKSSQKK